MATQELPTIEFIRQRLTYDGDTGMLLWLPRSESMFKADAKWSSAQVAARWNSRYAGKQAFTADDGHGYRVGAISNKQYRAHRVAWAIWHGAWPDQIDHINGDRADNRIANLRSVPQAENVKNSARREGNTSGRTGVSWYARRGLFRAYIATSAGVKHLGYFSTVGAASAARGEAEAVHGYHPNHGRSKPIA